ARRRDPGVAELLRLARGGVPGRIENHPGQLGGRRLTDREGPHAGSTWSDPLLPAGSGRNCGGQRGRRTMARPLNVGMVGYGFMARAHSSAWSRVANFFPHLEHRPALRAVAARTADRVSAFADVWGYESV